MQPAAIKNVNNSAEGVEENTLLGSIFSFWGSSSGSRLPPWSLYSCVNCTELKVDRGSSYTICCIWSEFKNLTCPTCGAVRVTFLSSCIVLSSRFKTAQESCEASCSKRPRKEKDDKSTISYLFHRDLSEFLIIPSVPANFNPHMCRDWQFYPRTIVPNIPLSIPPMTLPLPHSCFYSSAVHPSGDDMKEKREPKGTVGAAYISRIMNWRCVFI